ncbi:MAG: SIS domain-containing protein [Deltaproteobacteria bacterium]|nr:SIS domain-containing protein [Deltaproteobacteria bacterium]
MIKKIVEKAAANFSELSANDRCIQNVETASVWIIDAMKSGHKILCCGNGGSAADAQHFAGEFLCRFYKDRKPLPAIALTTDTSTLTAIANDYSYEEVFSRQVEALGSPGDLLFGISTSGASKNVLKAFQMARHRQVKTILLTGSIEREIAKISDLTIKVPSSDTPRIQEMLLLVEHILAEVVEKAFL